MEERRPIADVTVERGGKRMPLLSCALDQDAIGRDKDHLENREYVVRVEWLKAVSADEGVWDPGLFFRRGLTVAQLRDKATIDFVRSRLGVEGSALDETDVLEEDGSSAGR